MELVIDTVITTGNEASYTHYVLVWREVQQLTETEQDVDNGSNLKRNEHRNSTGKEVVKK
jgi:hypothetical protein